MSRALLLSIVVLSWMTPFISEAGIASKPMKEAAEYVMRKFGQEAAEEFGENSAELLTRKMGTLAVRHGDDVVVEACKKVGPRALRVVEEVGEEGAGKALKLMARHGDEALWVISRPKSLALFAKFGDDAAEAMIRHRAVAENLVEKFGSPMARALCRVNGQNARRLAMLADEGILVKVPQRDAVLDTIGNYGNAAADWIWRNKGAITVAAVAAAFVANPKPFIDGTVDVTRLAGEMVVQPVVDAAAKSTNWTLLLGGPLVMFLMVVTLKYVRSHWRQTGSRTKRPGAVTTVASSSDPSA